jgi:hypothetical protein
MIKMKYPHIIYNGMKKVRETLLKGAEGESQLLAKLSGKRIVFGPASGELCADEENLSGNRTEVLSIGCVVLFYT